MVFFSDLSHYSLNTRQYTKQDCILLVNILYTNQLIKFVYFYKIYLLSTIGFKINDLIICYVYILLGTMNIERNYSLNYNLYEYIIYL